MREKKPGRKKPNREERKIENLEEQTRKGEIPKTSEELEEVGVEKLKEGLENKFSELLNTITDENLRKELEGNKEEIIEDLLVKENPQDYLQKFFELKQNERYKGLESRVVIEALESEKAELFLDTFQLIKNDPELKEYPLFTNEILYEIVNGVIAQNPNLSAEDIKNRFSEILKELKHLDFQKMIEYLPKYFPPEEIFEEGIREEAPAPEAPPLEALQPEAPLAEAPVPEGQVGNLIERLTGEGREAKLMKDLVEAAARAGQLWRELSSIKYEPRVIRWIIFTDDGEERRQLLEKLREGKYNIPSKIFRDLPLNILLDRLGIKVETKDPFKIAALIAEKGYDIRRSLLELMGKIREVESLLNRGNLDDVERILRETDINAELNNIKESIEVLKDFFGSRRGLFLGKFKEITGMGLSAIGLWGLAIGWFLPLWLISQMFPAIEKQFK